ncbi:MAG: metal ABC transporter permease [Candidatus Sungbacteria bacterium]|nr:metal ABC transporter permease [Candidatus Sungbacteria bacterium]
METPFIQTLLMALVVGIASGSVGAFIILKRMALVGDALSHVALPGIALALAYRVDPFWGVLVFLLGAAVLVWWLEGKTKLPVEALVGLLFTASLAVGILTIPDTEILESLFGTFPAFSPYVLTAVLALAVILAGATFLWAKRFLFAVVSPELAKVSSGKKWEGLILFIVFAFVVALGIKLVGTLLMGALTIIPASVAKNISRSMTGFMVLSTALGGLIALGGVVIAGAFGLLPGPTIILLGVGLFIVSLLLGRK